MEQDLIIKMHSNLCNEINSTNLPVSAKYFVIKDIFEEIQFAYYKCYSQYQNNMQQKKEESEKITLQIPIENDNSKEDLEEKEN